MVQDKMKMVDLLCGFMQSQEDMKKEMKENADKIKEALDKEDYFTVAELSADMIMNCGKVLPVQELMEFATKQNSGLSD